MRDILDGVATPDLLHPTNPPTQKKKNDATFSAARGNPEQLTHASEVLVEQLHVSVNDLEHRQLVVALVHGAAEVQAGVPAGQQQDGWMDGWITQPICVCICVCVIISPACTSVTDGVALMKEFFTYMS